MTFLRTIFPYPTFSALRPSPAAKIAALFLATATTVVTVPPGFAVETLPKSQGLAVADVAPELAARSERGLALELVTHGLDRPIMLTAPVGDPRLFIVEQTGCIRVISDGALLPTPFLDLRAKIDYAGERGLLGLAFDPGYHQNGIFYACYSESETTHTVIARFRTTPDSGIADATTEEVLFKIPQIPQRLDHKAGWIGFRPGDGQHLYIATGDGGASNDPDNAAQDLSSLRGKILRIDVSGPRGYTVPKDNPFHAREGARGEIWAYGLRNPFRMSFDRETGDAYIGDVGQDTAEEVNFEPAGAKGGINYGWRQREGMVQNPASDVVPPVAVESTPALFAYFHSQLMIQRGAVIGGHVYRGKQLRDMDGRYLFSDFTNAIVWSLRKSNDRATDLEDHTPELNGDGQKFFYSGLTSFGEDSMGELYVTCLPGSVYKIVQTSEDPLASETSEDEAFAD